MKLVKMSGSVDCYHHIESFWDGGMKAVVWCCLAFCNEGVLSPNDLNVPLFQQLCSTATSQSEFNSDQIYSLSLSGNHQNCGSEVICWNQFMKWIPLVKIFSSVCNNDEMLVYCLYGFCAEIFGNNRAATKAQAPTHSFALAFLCLAFFKSFWDIQKCFAFFKHFAQT